MAPEAQQLTVNGARIRYQVSGNGAPVVVQAPGWGIGAGAYGPSLSPLAATSTLVSYDPRGSGNSQRDVDPKIFHRRIKILFNNRIQTMDLINKKNIIHFKVRE